MGASQKYAETESRHKRTHSLSLSCTSYDKIMASFAWYEHFTFTNSCYHACSHGDKIIPAVSWGRIVLGQRPDYKGAQEP